MTKASGILKKKKKKKKREKRKKKEKVNKRCSKSKNTKMLCSRLAAATYLAVNGINPCRAATLR